MLPPFGKDGLCTGNHTSETAHDDQECRCHYFSVDLCSWSTPASTDRQKMYKCVPFSVLDIFYVLIHKHRMSELTLSIDEIQRESPQLSCKGIQRQPSIPPVQQAAFDLS